MRARHANLEPELIVLPSGASFQLLSPRMCATQQNDLVEYVCRALKLRFILKVGDFLWVIVSGARFGRGQDGTAPRFRPVLH
ncbi:hypothetical protein RvY_14318-2 [Ramazzottius varieornatus]|uniref:Uncharacterized protein n=1 Tax=Ramazzottius varieornatus TaxID=947166 RepID=A0A1D1VQX3_RAMVA|nr:hypothetical protein RvY_14318-2 [Ramazzottius varieornatus]